MRMAAYCSSSSFFTFKMKWCMVHIPLLLTEEVKYHDIPAALAARIVRSSYAATAVLQYFEVGGRRGTHCCLL